MENSDTFSTNETVRNSLLISGQKIIKSAVGFH